MKKGRESCRVDGSSSGGGGGLADVLITEFLISNISQKRGEGNESGRGEERASPNGGAEGIPSREPSGQRQCQARSYPIFIFRSIEEGGKRAEKSQSPNFTQERSLKIRFFSVAKQNSSIFLLFCVMRLMSPAAATRLVGFR